MTGLLVAALSEAGQRAAALAVAAAGALAVWTVVLTVLALASRPRLPEPAPGGLELGGPEPPAVVSLLAGRWELGREAVPATLLDLAARGAVALEQVSPERFVCRIRRPGPDGPSGDLLPYERQVLDHVRRLSSDGVVPCEALTTGPEEESGRWWKGFEKAVVADARRRGLSRGRWGRAAMVTLGVVAVVPAVLAALAFVTVPDDTPAEDDDPVGAAVALTAVGWGALLAIPLSLRAERDTPEGLAAAARWLGLRQHLAENEAFDRAPPAAVAIWDRYLAYGAALGVAAGAVRALPLGCESDSTAWSAYGGRWHTVRVRYPARLPPGWGKPPALAAAQGLGALLAAGVVAGTIGPPLAGALSDAPRIGDGDFPSWLLIPMAFFAALLVVLAVFLLRSAVMLALAVADLGRRRDVEGIVIRARDGYVAVDDGRSERVRAWRVDPTKASGAGRGAVVRATVSPRLGHVYQLEPVLTRPSQAGLARAPMDTMGEAAAKAAERYGRIPPAT